MQLCIVTGDLATDATGNLRPYGRQQDLKYTPYITRVSAHQ